MVAWYWHYVLKLFIRNEMISIFLKHMKVPPGYVDHIMLVNDMLLTSNIHHFYAKCSNKLEFIVDVMTKMFYYDSDSKMIIFVTVWFFFVLVSHIRVHLHNNCSIYFSEKTRCIQCLSPPQLLWCWCGPRVWRTPCQWSASTIGKFSKFVSCFGRKRCFSACCWHTWSQNHHQFQYSNEFIVAAMRKALPTTRW